MTLLRRLRMDDDRDADRFTSPTKLSSANTIEGGLERKFPLEEAGEMVFALVLGVCGRFFSRMGASIAARGIGVAMSSASGLGGDDEPAKVMFNWDELPVEEWPLVLSARRRFCKEDMLAREAASGEPVNSPNSPCGEGGVTPIETSLWSTDSLESSFMPFLEPLMDMPGVTGRPFDLPLLVID